MKLTKTCNNVATTKVSYACSTDTMVGYPKRFIYGAQGESITAVGTTPTPAEVQTFLNSKKGFTFEVTNGAFTPPELQTITGADTIDGLDEVTQENIGVSGKLKVVNNSVIEMLTKNNLNNSRMQLWIVDSNNQLHGGVKGFSIPYYIQNFEHSGWGSKAEINIAHKWERKEDIFTPVSTPDADYLTLKNYITEGIYTETSVTTYVAGQVTGYENITGWDKDLYPTLYFNINSNVIKIYPTVTDRTADMNTLASVDSATSLSLTELNSSGFGGALTFVSNAITDASEWNVDFSS